MRSGDAVVRLWYLPPGIEPGAIEATSARERLRRVTPELVRAAVAALDVHRSEIASLTIASIVAAVDAVVRSWTATVPCNRYMQALLEHGPALTGYSRPALKYALCPMLQRFDGDGLERLLRDEFGDPKALDGFAESGGSVRRMVRGPGRQLHVLAGSVPTAGIFSLICALLVKSPVLVKTSKHDPLFPALFAQALAEVEPRLATAMAVLPWPGGDEAIEREAMNGVGAVVACGSDATVDAIRRRVPASARFLGYGNKLSIATITREALSAADARTTASRAAWDVALFDQQGCLSPQVLFVERGGEVTPEQFGALLAEELQLLAVSLPRGSISTEEAAAIQELRAMATFRASLDSGVRVWESDRSTDWTVLLEPRVHPSHLVKNRTAVLVPVDDLATGAAVHGTGLPISTIGIAAAESRLVALAAAFSTMATRICSLGRMGEPSVTWRHDGRPNLSDLVTWSEWEKPWKKEQSEKSERGRRAMAPSDAVSRNVVQL